MPDGLTFLCWAVGVLVLLYVLKCVVLFVLLVAGIWSTAQERRR